MSKVFRERQITADGKVLPLSEFRLFRDFESHEFVPEKMVVVVEKAEKYLEEDIPFITLYDYRLFKITGNRSDYQSKFYKRRDMLFAISLAEHYEGKGRFTSKIADLVWCILEETSWVIHAHAIHNPSDPTADVPPVYDEDTLHGVDLFSAVTGALLVTVLNLNRAALDELSPIIAERITYEVKKRLIKPFVSRHFGWCGESGGKCNNWCTWITDNMLYITALVEEDLYTRTAVVNRALKYLDNYTSWIPDDGGCDEGPSYWGGAGACYFSALEIIYDMTGGEIDVFDHPHVRAMGEYIAKFNINDDRYINFADCGPSMYPDGFLITRYGRRCGSEMLTAFGLMVSKKCSTYPSRNHIYRGLKDLMMPIPTNAEVTKAERFVWFPGLKVMIARESEDTSRGMFLAIKGGHNNESHNHNDVGHFIIYHDGEPVIIDAGPVKYTRDTFGSKRYTFWAMQSHYHNLPAFDGFGEKNGRDYASTRELYDEESHRISLGLERAYEKGAGVVSYTRSAELQGGTAVITEDVVLDSEREIDFRLMTHRPPELIEPGKVALTEGRTLIYDTALEFSIEEFDPKGTTNIEDRWGTPVLYRMHFKIHAKEYKGEFKFV